MAKSIILARTSGSIKLFEGPNGGSPVKSIPAQSFYVSSDGSLLVATQPDVVDVYSGDASTKIITIQEPNVVFTAVSPAKGYLVTCQKPSKEAGQAMKNLKVWDLRNGACIVQLTQKRVLKDDWPVVHWTWDDSILAHAVTNTVHVYAKKGNFSVYQKVTVKGIAGLAITPAENRPVQLAAFVPEAKGSPAVAGICNVDCAATEPSEAAMIVRKSFFRCQGAKLLWNKLGTAVLVLAFTDVDATNQSYYGEQKLHYLPADAAEADQACTVPMPKEGPVHDVQWSPTGDFFAVVAGFIPAKVMLFDAACKPVYDLGSGPYNMIHWNPFGRFLAVAGFGNLPGDIVFYDKKASGACKQMGATRSPAVTAEWSPDGRQLLVATTAPRLRVDNNFKVLTYYGQQVHTQPFDMLFEATWLPAAPGTFSDRPQSPERLAAASNASEAAASSPAAPKAASYRPPHSRAGVVGSGPKQQFSLAYDAEDKPGKVAAMFANRIKPAPPGAEFVSKGASSAAAKNAKKRANKKKKEVTELGEQDDASETTTTTTTEQATSSTPAQPVDPSASSASAAAAPGGDVEKRLRALHKKLRQIQQLKERRSEEGDAALEPEQLQKIESEASVLEEIASLGGTA